MMPDGEQFAPSPPPPAASAVAACSLADHSGQGAEPAPPPLVQPVVLYG